MERALALAIGFLLDVCFGDPLRALHPVVLMGKGISLCETGLRGLFPQTPHGELAAGAVMTALLPLTAFFAAWGLLALAGWVHPLLRFALSCFFCWQALACKCLRAAAMQVYRALLSGDIAAARQAVGGIVGRDTAALDEAEITRATVETVAENTSDGVVAPLFFFALGGAPLALAYKAVNTVDSMVGYKNERYLYFGRAAAKLDDAANWLPARLTGLLMALAAFFGFDGPGALRVWRRDRKNHTSPNAGQPEAACAGALGVQLGGDSVYFGAPVHKPTLGDATRPLAAADIPRACRLMVLTSALAALLCCAAVAAVALLVQAGRAAL